jgi:UDP-N-acetylmuramoylalanine--D-glutamate ligase
MTNWEDKKVTVFGLGRSGAAIARKLVPLKAQVTITEELTEEQLDPQLVSEMRELKVNLELGGHANSSIEGAELVVMSPGVHLNIPVILEARKRNLPVISEIELAFRFTSKPIIAVTGTNGKTTTTTLIGEFLRAGNKKTAVAGNIGAPLVEVDDRELDFVVAEISSYQLETIVTFRPWISLILNLAEDHIERHKSMEEYAAAKARIFMNQGKTDYLIYNSEDKLVSQMATSAEARLVPFSKKDSFLNPREILIPGEHNLENALAAAQAALICGISRDTIRRVLKTFPGVEHRIEFVTEKRGVKFYNDSKGTNPDSTLVALKSLSNGQKNIILIAGGRDKGGDLTDLVHLISDTVKNVILIGEAAQRFGGALQAKRYQSLVLTADLAQAVNTSYSLAQPGDAILLSPACASFDMFRNFEERGRIFKQLVAELPE